MSTNYNPNTDRKVNPATLPETLAARAFLEALDGSTGTFTFQTFDDNKPRDESLTRTLVGSFDDHADELAELNNRGAGIFVTINETKGKRRRAEDVTRVRGVFVDDDTPRKKARTGWAVTPSMTVESSPGKYHYYWFGDLPLETFSAVQIGLSRKYDTDAAVIDLPRIMRLPGFANQKGKPFITRIETASGTRYATEEILSAYPPPTDAQMHKHVATSDLPPSREAGRGDRKRIDKIAKQCAEASTVPGAKRRGKHIIDLGIFIGKENLPYTDRLIDFALDTFEEDMDPLNSSGEAVGMERTNAREQIEYGLKIGLAQYSKTIAADFADEPGDSRPVKMRGLTPLRMAVDDLMAMEFPPTTFVIDKMLPAGSALLYGKPKKGKSWLALLIGLHVIAGKPIFGYKTDPGSVLHLSLEDNWARCKKRIDIGLDRFGIDRGTLSGKLDIMIESPRFEAGLEGMLEEYLREKPDTRMIIIDILVRIRREKKSSNLYEEDYAVGEAISKITKKYPRLLILVVHHAGKGEKEDPADTASGTTGLTGGFDTVLSIVDQGGNRDLYVTGRDVESQEVFPLYMDEGFYTLATAEESLATDPLTRGEVYRAIDAEGVSRKEILAATDLTEAAVDMQLKRMVNRGLLAKAGRGHYRTVETCSPFDDFADDKDEDLSEESRALLH